MTIQVDVIRWGSTLVSPFTWHGNEKTTASQKLRKYSLISVALEENLHQMEILSLGAWLIATRFEVDFDVRTYQIVAKIDP